MKYIRLVLMGLALSAAVIAGWYLISGQMDKTTEITNFEQCAAAGNPVQESYPEVCRTPDGNSFTRTIE